MNEPRSLWNTLAKDAIAGMVVFFVALPLCLGVANASKAADLADNLNASILSGIIAGIIGGIVVGLLSGSHTSVSGPAAGLTAVVASQIAGVGSFQGFLVAVVLAGVLQIVLAALRAGSLAEFFPSSVIKGLLAAIGIILILKQLPHLVGHDHDPEGEMAFNQPDNKTTFTELIDTLDDFNQSALIIGLTSLLFLIVWDRSKKLKHSPIPAPLLVVLLGIVMNKLFAMLGNTWLLDKEHLVSVPVAATAQDFLNNLTMPSLSALWSKSVYIAAVVIAVVASLETMLNIEAVDKLDPQQRRTPTNRELLAQGVGNITSGLLGGLPVTSVIVRSSVNINAGAQTKLSAIIHGVLLLLCVAFIPQLLNTIPLSCLAAILIMTGYKLASPKLVKQMWAQGWDRFLPFVITVVAIVRTDLLVGILIGLGASMAFIIYSNLRYPSRCIHEKHIGGDVIRIELANQVSFLNRANLTRLLEGIPLGGHVLLDARSTDYIDPDILDLINDYREQMAPARGINVSMLGFKDRYAINDQILFADYTTRELQTKMTPADVVKLLKDGNERFRRGQRLNRDLGREVTGTSTGQYPLAVVLSCIDSRTPVELVFDLGLGDVFSIRIAGNVTKEKVLGSIEYACAVAKSKLIVVLGHTKCGAVTAAIDLHFKHQTAFEATGCEHLDALLNEIQKSIPPQSPQPSVDLKDSFVDLVTRQNVIRTIGVIREQSPTLQRLIDAGEVSVIGGMYDVATGRVEFFNEISKDNVSRH